MNEPTWRFLHARRARRALSATVSLGLLVSLSHCNSEEKPKDAEALEPSPNATITPSPLSPVGSLTAKPVKNPNPSKSQTKRTGVTDVGDPPVPLAIQQPPTPDSGNPKQGLQASLEGRLFWPSFPSQSKTAASSAQKGSDQSPRPQRHFAVQLRPHGRMQVTFSGNMFSFASGTSIASRIENYGHFLLWPNDTAYRVLLPGSVRTLLLEGRPDVTPMFHVESEPRPGPEVFDHATQVWSLETPRGKLHLQQAKIDEVELGGPLLCRFLLEWLSVEPSSTICDAGLVPTRAEFESPRQGRLVWETTTLDVRSDQAVTSLLVPPPDATYRQYGLPEPEAVVAPSELPLLRKGGRTGTLTVHNPSAQLVWLLLDNLATARVSPNAAWSAAHVSQGTYTARLVDFFGTEALGQPGLVIGDSGTLGTPKAPLPDTEQ